MPRSGPFEVRAELGYQPIGFRWAPNLADYDAVETIRFVRYYQSLSHVSGTVLAGAARRIEQGRGGRDGGRDRVPGRR